MAGARKTFRAPLWGTIGLVLSGSICAAAGLWQIDRAQQKRELFDAFSSGDSGPIRNQLITDDAADSALYQHFSVQGRYDGAHQVLIDNMMLDGRNGYQILTPLRTEKTSVLVNRGWIPANPDRSVLPDISIDDRLRQVSGRLNRLPRPGLRLDAPDTIANAPWPRRMLFPEAQELVAQLGYAVYGYQLLLDPEDPDGFVRDWRPNLMSPEKHMAYAIQWFLFGLTVLIIYFVVNWKAPDGDTPDD
jgi:surfeit locus 1 family protein